MGEKVYLSRLCDASKQTLDLCERCKNDLHSKYLSSIDLKHFSPPGEFFRAKPGSHYRQQRSAP